MGCYRPPTDTNIQPLFDHFENIISENEHQRLLKVGDTNINLCKFSLKLSDHNGLFDASIY